ncbi:hypothetical protein O5264_28400, partial [Escherichia coli]|nr:hypothetical protein [Escherichia coli]
YTARPCDVALAHTFCAKLLRYKFGDDLMIKAETTPQGADDAAKIIAVCRGIRHILTPVAWIICTALVAYTTIYLNR